MSSRVTLIPAEHAPEAQQEAMRDYDMRLRGATGRKLSRDDARHWWPKATFNRPVTTYPDDATRTVAERNALVHEQFN